MCNEQRFLFPLLILETPLNKQKQKQSRATFYFQVNGFGLLEVTKSQNDEQISPFHCLIQANERKS